MGDALREYTSGRRRIGLAKGEPWWTAQDVISSTSQDVIDEMNAREPKADESPAPGLAEIIDWVVPDFSEMDWEQIIHLREHRFVSVFQDWLLGQVREKGDSLTQVELEDRIQEGLWELSTRVEPNPKSTILKGFLGNIPLPIPLNPVSVVDAVDASRRDIGLAKDLG